MFFFRFTRMSIIGPTKYQAEIPFQNSITVAYGEYLNRSDHLVCRFTPLIHVQFKKSLLCKNDMYFSRYDVDFIRDTITNKTIKELSMSR